MRISDGELTSIALCWRMERADGAGLALTGHDQRVVSEGMSFDCSPGMVPAAVTRSLGLDPHSAEISGALNSEALDANDLALGRWDGARVMLTAVDWQDDLATPIELISGEIGAISVNGEGFSAELRGASAKLQVPVCPATSSECRAAFGDKQCRVDLAGRTIMALVVASDSGELTLDRAIDDRYLLGRIRYLSGANCGLASVIIGVGSSAVRVRDLPRAPVEVGCRVALREGCDKRFATCRDRFANAVNFRGEPHLPGNDLLTRYPGV
jgi:uncharacterized phage protein (TIGR02218 family)